MFLIYYLGFIVLLQLEKETLAYSTVASKITTTTNTQLPLLQYHSYLLDGEEEISEDQRDDGHQLH